MKVTEYIKIEELKGLIAKQLITMKMFEQVRVINDADLDLIISMMAQLFTELRGMETDDERLEFLVAYVIGLWGRLIIDYGAKLDEL